jgi:hypothetical protein
MKFWNYVFSCFINSGVSSGWAATEVEASDLPSMERTTLSWCLYPMSVELEISLGYGSKGMGSHVKKLGIQLAEPELSKWSELVLQNPNQQWADQNSTQRGTLQLGIWAVLQKQCSVLILKIMHRIAAKVPDSVPIPLCNLSSLIC